MTTNFFSAIYSLLLKFCECFQLQNVFNLTVCSSIVGCPWSPGSLWKNNSLFCPPTLFTTNLLPTHSSHLVYAIAVCMSWFSSVGGLV